MAEWTMATVLKTVVGANSPGVRIPLPPLRGLLRQFNSMQRDLSEVYLTGEMPEWSIGAAC
jgi:hypothetical protein